MREERDDVRDDDRRSRAAAVVIAVDRDVDHGLAARDRVEDAPPRALVDEMRPFAQDQAVRGGHHGTSTARALRSALGKACGAAVSTAICGEIRRRWNCGRRAPRQHAPPGCHLHGTQGKKVTC